MGCGESKHNAVATGNTTAAHRRKPNFNIKKHKDLETIPEADSEAGKEFDNDVAAAAVGPPRVVAADVKDITVNTEMKKGEEQKELVCGESPDRYFSSRKDEDAIKAIVEEAGSGYCTPHPEPDKDCFFDGEDGKSTDDDADRGKQILMTKIEAKLVSAIENGKGSWRS